MYFGNSIQSQDIMTILLQTEQPGVETYIIAGGIVVLAVIFAYIIAKIFGGGGNSGGTRPR